MTTNEIAYMALFVALVALYISVNTLIAARVTFKKRDEEELPASTFLLTADQREAMAPEVQARVFQEETLARISKRR